MTHIVLLPVRRWWVAHFGWGPCLFPTMRRWRGIRMGTFAAHALTDALLAAAGLGDLGTNFGGIASRVCRSQWGSVFACGDADVARDRLGGG
ncbi:Uncharacterised protein [Mobiluncus curtisii]|uniref:Uncharacterized protein n=1 Tax=Mobiluncus curtisii TaxID=2051 RepID=A0A2X3BQH0_9ACTO|nr:Uncharacterised protein [Mobiluncus curtisii]